MHRKLSLLLFNHQVMPDSLGPHGISLPGASVHEIFQVRILEWVAISFSKGSSQPSDQSTLNMNT